jgi:hypothetical protein
MTDQPLTAASLNDVGGAESSASASEHPPHRQSQLDLIEEHARNSWLSAVKGEEEDVAESCDGIELTVEERSRAVAVFLDIATEHDIVVPVVLTCDLCARLFQCGFSAEASGFIRSIITPPNPNPLV